MIGSKDSLLQTLAYEGLLFSFAEMEREIENMSSMAKQFLERETFEKVIPEWKRQLKLFKEQAPGTGQRWEISEGSPIQTVKSKGEYERKGGRGRAVFGRISGAWDIRIPAKVKKKSRPSAAFVLLGLASTNITILSHEDSGEHLELARWTLDIGDAKSPGCHFHTQIDLEDEDHKFPKSLSVPRFPALLHTPMDALEFLLAELFQDRWLQHTSRGSDFVTNWATCQKKRLSSVLDWQRQVVMNTSGSPWTSLKKQKPKINLFLHPSEDAR